MVLPFAMAVATQIPLGDAASVPVDLLAGFVAAVADALGACYYYHRRRKHCQAMLNDCPNGVADFDLEEGDAAFAVTVASRHRYDCFLQEIQAHPQYLAQ